ncbi:MAG: GNAT family N-acetyltransferase [Planctomycetes bacterium]|nr:GNAT family N-acetyltransferase [Planctomycetota bacterium]
MHTMANSTFLAIREIAPGDAEPLFCLYNHRRGPDSKRTFRAFGGESCTVEPCLATIADNYATPRQKFDVVAGDGTHLAGWGFVWKLLEPEPLFGLLVADAWQNQGLGRKVAMAALAGADALGLPAVHLTVVADNHHAIRLYASLGFIDTGGFRHDDGLDYRRMVRRR